MNNQHLPGRPVVLPLAAEQLRATTAVMEPGAMVPLHGQTAERLPPNILFSQMTVEEERKVPFSSALQFSA